MQFNVSQLLREPVGASRLYEVRCGDSERDDEAYVRGEVELLHVQGGVLVRAELDVPAEDECARCLTSFGARSSVEFEEVFHQTHDAFTGANLHPQLEPGAFTIDERHIVDLREAIRQYQVLAAPIQPLCTEECRGFCPACGADLREADCSCRETATDPRWASLAGLKLND
jgi:uncharacterized protein